MPRDLVSFGCWLSQRSGIIWEGQLDFKESFGIKSLIENLGDQSIENQLFFVGVDENIAGTREMNERSQNGECVSENFMMPLSELRASPLREFNPFRFIKSEKYKLEKVTIDWDTCIKKCSEETLIYIFSNIIDETMQMSAVEELYKKGWRYHKKLLVWMIPGSSDQNNVSKEQSSERERSNQINSSGFGGGGWSYFNLSEWKIMTMPSSFPPIKEEEFAKLSEFRETTSSKSNSSHDPSA